MKSSPIQLQSRNAGRVLEKDAKDVQSVVGMDGLIFTMTDEKVDYKNSVKDNIGVDSSASLRLEQQADENVFEGHLQGLALANAQRQLMIFKTGVLNIVHISQAEAEKSKKKSTSPPSAGDVNADKQGGGIANLQDFAASNANAQDGREGTSMEIKEVLEESSTRGLLEGLAFHHNEKELITATVTGSPDYVEDLMIEEASNIMKESVIISPAGPPCDFLVTKEIVLGENSDSVMKNIRVIRQIRDLTRADINVLQIQTCCFIRENIPSEYKDSSSSKIIIKGRKEDVETAYKLINKLLAAIKKSSYVAGPAPSKVSASGIGYLHSEELTTEGCTEVQVYAMENPNQFWLQIHGTKWNQYKNLISEMTKFYNQEIQSPENQYSLQVNSISAGEIVAAFDREYKEWCRAQVVAVSTDQKNIIVFDLDTGETLSLSPNLLCILNPKFFPLPFQAIECCLAGVKPKYDEWSQEAIDTFENIVDQRTGIKAKPIDKLMSVNGEKDLQKTVQLVKLIDLNTGNDVSCELIDRGYGTSVYEYSVLREGKNRKNKCACVIF